MAIRKPSQGEPVTNAPQTPVKAPTSMMPSIPTLRTPDRCDTASPKAANRIGVPRRSAAAIRPTKNISSMTGSGGRGGAAAPPSDQEEREDHRRLDDPKHRIRNAEPLLQRRASDRENAENQRRDRNGECIEARHQRHGDAGPADAGCDGIVEPMADAAHLDPAGQSAEPAAHGHRQYDDAAERDAAIFRRVAVFADGVDLIAEYGPPQHDVQDRRNHNGEYDPGMQAAAELGHRGGVRQHVG